MTYQTPRLALVARAEELVLGLPVGTYDSMSGQWDEDPPLGCVLGLDD
jgi:hypothetical protein